MMRIKIMLRVVLCAIVISAVLVTLTFWTRCGDMPLNANAIGSSIGHRSNIDAYDYDEITTLADKQKMNDQNFNAKQDVSDISCVINNEYNVPCKEDTGGEVYVPFSFLHDYFEVYGERVDGKKKGEKPHFDWQHSYSKIFKPRGMYSPTGVFMSFEHYNVEIRERVKCISGIHGVPISTQWSANGYFYPIQISQFGLSHYSKNLTEKEPTVITYEDGQKVRRSKWLIPKDGSRLERVTDNGMQSVIRFQTSESRLKDGIRLMLDKSSPLLVLSLDFKFVNNASVTVVLRHRSNGKMFNVHYVQNKVTLQSKGNNIYYGIGIHSVWSRMTRDLIVDLQKGLSLQQIPKKQNKANKIRIDAIIIRGTGFLDNLTLSSTNHMTQFFDAAKWLIANQDSEGGWPISVTRKISGGALVLPPGWYSAMAQGQAISVLVRAFHRSGNKTYLNAALDATKLYRVPSENHGIMTKFENNYIWFEEYPTVPSSYVLNGFMYSLIGLYDVKTVCPLRRKGRLCTDANKLYEEGVKTLRKMLSLYDSGSGSIYDLKHYTLGSAPNLARWDYHSTHINQLLLFSTIESDPIFETTAERWISYMKGKRAAHN
ncbi:GLCE (predicted) [Pycnogonum litorale]